MALKMAVAVSAAVAPAVTLIVAVSMRIEKFSPLVGFEPTVILPEPDEVGVSFLYNHEAAPHLCILTCQP